MGFITAREAWGGDNRKSGAKTGTRRNPVPFDIKELQESPVRPEQAKASPVGLEQAIERGGEKTGEAPVPFDIEENEVATSVSKSCQT